nr:disulfide bond formation protein DsbB [Sansalvadorimonas sp. 2012CJ34-2]
MAKMLNDFRSSPLGAIRSWQNSRVTWLIMLVTAISLESTAWFFQYVMLMDPCEMCVYQRLAVMLLAAAAIVMLIEPGNRFVRGAGYLIWITGALYGLQAAMKQIGYYGDEGLFLTCKILPDFPFGLPLYDWWPDMFMPTGFCGQDDWLFLGQNMAQWMCVIFGIYILAFVLCIVSLFKKDS